MDGTSVLTSQELNKYGPINPNAIGIPVTNKQKNDDKNENNSNNNSTSYIECYNHSDDWCNDSSKRIERIPDIKELRKKRETHTHTQHVRVVVVHNHQWPWKTAIQPFKMLIS